MTETIARCKRSMLGGKIHAFGVGRDITLCGQKCPEFRVKSDDTEITCDRCASRLRSIQAI